MREIATMLGISINAVSLALNDKKGVSDIMRLKILETANTLGYLDRNARFSRTFDRHYVCVMMQDMYSKTGFYSEILHSVVQEARNWGWDILLQHFNDENMLIPDCILMRHVSGIIIMGKISTPNVEKLLALGTRIVMVDHSPMLSNINCVLTDNKAGGYIATRHLIRRGFKKIGFFGDLSYTLSVKDRYYGFLEALVREGIICIDEQEEYTRKYSIIGKIEPYILAHDTAALEKFLSRQKTLPEAFFCSNDAAALILMQILKKKNLQVPRDISVIGFDNGRLAENSDPKLTSVNVNRELMGCKAVRKFLDLIEDRDRVVEHTVLGVELVERDSVPKAL